MKRKKWKKLIFIELGMYLPMKKTLKIVRSFGSCAEELSSTDPKRDICVKSLTN